MTSAVIFGGAGFIGTHLAGRLVAEGHRVVVVDARMPDRPVDGIHYVRWDIREPVPLDVASNPEVVYNLAAVHRTPGHRDAEYFATNVRGAENVTAFCRDHDVRQLCFTSSVSVYGPSEEPKDESSDTNPASAYGKSKLAAENIHQSWAHEDASRRLVIVRPAAVFGPGEGGNFTRLAKALRSGFFFYPGRTDTVKACTYVGELVRSFEFTLGLDRPEFLYNFCYPKPYTIEEICGVLQDVADLPAPRGRIPARAMLTVGRVADGLVPWKLAKGGFGTARVRKLIESTHYVPKAVTDAGFHFQGDLRDGVRAWLTADPSGQLV